MKQMLFSLALLVAGIGISTAQCVVVADKSTGVWGVGYNDDGLPTSYKDCRELAAGKCSSNGGVDCAPLYQGSEKGWWAIISGFKPSGDVLIELVSGKETEYAAEMAVRKQYDSKGGVSAERVAAYGWYVHSNVR